MPMSIKTMEVPASTPWIVYLEDLSQPDKLLFICFCSSEGYAQNITNALQKLDSSPIRKYYFSIGKE